MTAWHYTARSRALRRLRLLQARHLCESTVTLSPIRSNQVIYVVYDISDPRLVYVGQTINTVFHRFKQHICNARAIFNGDTSDRDLLHRTMAHRGWHNFRIFPIEHVPGYFPNSKEGRAEFRRTALPRELFWKRVLHAFAPNGLCLEGKSSCHRARSQSCSTAPALAPLVLGAAPIPSARQFLSRDWDRKIRYILSRIQSGRFQASELTLHAQRNIYRLYDVLFRTRAAHWGFPLQHVALLREALLQNMNSDPVSAPAPPLQIPVIQLFLHSELDRLGLASIIAQDDLWQTLMPPAMRVRLSRPILCFKYSKPASLAFCNVSKIARMSNEEIRLLLSKPCACSKPSFARFLKEGEHHILTTDASLLRSPALISAWEKGSKFRSDIYKPENEDLGVMSIDPLDDIIRATTSWKHAVTSALGNSVTSFITPWIKEVTERMTAQALHYFGSLGASHGKPLLSKTDMHRLHALQRVFAFTTIDKAGNNFCVVCKKHYVERCLDELKNGVAYSPRDVTISKLHLDAKSTLARFYFSMVACAKVPHFMGTFKFHKQPVGIRFMAGSAQSAMKPLSVGISLGLKALMPDVDALWNSVSARIPGFAPHGSWIISDSTAVPTLVQRCRKSWKAGGRIATYDFSTMYTTLPHADMKSRLRALIVRLFARRLESSRARFLLVRKDGSCAWLNCQRTVMKGEMILSVENLPEMIDALIDSMFVQFGETIYQQTVGVPMGTNCAGFLANLYCFTYELEFMERLISQGHFEVALSFQRCQRYIDDLLCLDVEKFEEFMYQTEGNTFGIYPAKFLSLSPEKNSCSCVPYMDIALRFSRSRGLYTAIYDKRLESKYADIHVIRYPDCSSILASLAKYGIVTSQLHRFAKRCTRVSDFTYNVALVIYRMKLKGYRETICWQYVRKYFRQHLNLYGGGRSIGCWLRLLLKPFQLLVDGKITPGPYGELQR
jgi:hypothetical protein